MKLSYAKQACAAIVIVLIFLSCSKSGPTPPTNPCDGVTVVINATVTNTSGPVTTDGSIVATASGASGITFSLNGGAFQSSGNFASLAPGSYLITARSTAGCIGTGNFSVAAGDPCAGKTITVTAVQTNSEPCGNTGTVTITAAGSTGFTYRLNASGTYQASNVFSNLATGTFTAFAKDAAGCEQSISITVLAIPVGPLFTATKNLIANKCGSCHIATVSGGVSYASDCNIVNGKNGMKAQAVDANLMPKGGPALTTEEKKIISDWIAAGGTALN